MIKIALLLRGQPRFSAEGAELFKRFILKNHPNLDLKVFAHSWDSLSRRMTSSDSEKRKEERAIFDRIAHDEVIGKIHPWNPSKCQVETEVDTFKLAGEIKSKLVEKEKITYEWYKNYLKLNNWDITDPAFNNRNLIMPEGLLADDTFTISKTHYSDQMHLQLMAELYDEQIRLTYLLGQMYSAGKSLSLLQTFSNDYQWNPDIVISTRYDVFMWVFSFPRLINDYRNMRRDGSPIIWSKAINIIDGRPVMNDYAFIGDLVSFTSFLSNIRKRLYSAFTNNSMEMMNVIGSGKTLQHLLWTKLPDSDVKFIQPSFGHWNAEILRPGYFDLNDVEHGNEEEFKELQKRAMDYEYPINPNPMSKEEIFNLWKHYNGET